ncbi:MAG: hypothetical protein WKG07_27835 [Hymenobacter sp.]
MALARSTDGHARHDVAVLEDSTTGEFSYQAIIQSTDGLVYIAYAYDRTNTKHGKLKATKQ